MAEVGGLTILALCGSLRQASNNAGLRRALPAFAPDGMTIAPLDGIGDFPLYDGDIETAGIPPVVAAFGATIRAADGVIFCTPEYNNSVPGVLKNALDWLSRLPQQPFSEKPVAVQSVSTGPYGGVRCQLALRPVLATLNAYVLNRPGVLVANAKDKFDAATGDLTDRDTKELVGKQLAAFQVFVKRMRV